MNSTTKIIAGVAVFALLFAGIGFAISYEGKVTSTGNDVDIAYITVNAGDEVERTIIGDNSKISFNTETASNGSVTYTLSQNSIVAGNFIIVQEGLELTTVDVVIKEDTTAIFNGTNFELTIGDKTATFGTDSWSAEGVAIPSDGVITVTFAVKGTASFSDEQIEIIKGATEGFAFIITATGTA